MQLPSLVSEAEAETVICFCFLTAPDSELPAVKPERGSTDFCAGVGVGGGWGAHAPCGCTHAQTTHYGHTCDTQMLIHPLS